MQLELSRQKILLTTSVCYFWYVSNAFWVWYFSSKALVGPFTGTVAVRDIFEILGAVLERAPAGKNPKFPCLALDTKVKTYLIFWSFDLNSLLSVCGKNSEPQVSPSDLRRSAEQWKWLHSFCLPSCWTLSHHSHATAVRWLLSSQCGDHVGATRMFIKELLTWRQAQVSGEACELSLVFIGNSISQ